MRNRILFALIGLFPLIGFFLGRNRILFAIGFFVLIGFFRPTRTLTETNRILV